MSAYHRSLGRVFRVYVRGRMAFFIEHDVCSSTGRHQGDVYVRRALYTYSIRGRGMPRWFFFIRPEIALEKEKHVPFGHISDKM